MLVAEALYALPLGRPWSAKSELAEMALKSEDPYHCRHTVHVASLDVSTHLSWQWRCTKWVLDWQFGAVTASALLAKPSWQMMHSSSASGTTAGCMKYEAN